MRPQRWQWMVVVSVSALLVLMRVFLQGPLRLAGPDSLSSPQAQLRIFQRLSAGQSLVFPLASRIEALKLLLSLEWPVERAPAPDFSLDVRLWRGQELLYEERVWVKVPSRYQTTSTQHTSSELQIHDPVLRELVVGRVADDADRLELSLGQPTDSSLLVRVFQLPQLASTEPARWFVLSPQGRPGVEFQPVEIYRVQEEPALPIAGPPRASGPPRAQVFNLQGPARIRVQGAGSGLLHSPVGSEELPIPAEVELGAGIHSLIIEGTPAEVLIAEGEAWTPVQQERRSSLWYTLGTPETAQLDWQLVHRVGDHTSPHRVRIRVLEPGAADSAHVELALLDAAGGLVRRLQLPLPEEVDAWAHTDDVQPGVACERFLHVPAGVAQLRVSSSRPCLIRLQAFAVSVPLASALDPSAPLLHSLRPSTDAPARLLIEERPQCLGTEARVPASGDFRSLAAVQDAGAAQLLWPTESDSWGRGVFAAAASNLRPAADSQAWTALRRVRLRGENADDELYAGSWQQAGLESAGVFLLETESLQQGPALELWRLSTGWRASPEQAVRLVLHKPDAGPCTVSFTVCAQATVTDFEVELAIHSTNEEVPLPLAATALTHLRRVFTCRAGNDDRRPYLLGPQRGRPGAAVRVAAVLGEDLPAGRYILELRPSTDIWLRAVARASWPDVLGRHWLPFEVAGYEHVRLRYPDGLREPAEVLCLGPAGWQPVEPEVGRLRLPPGARRLAVRAAPADLGRRVELSQADDSARTARLQSATRAALFTPLAPGERVSFPVRPGAGEQTVRVQIRALLPADAATGDSVLLAIGGEVLQQPTVVPLWPEVDPGSWTAAGGPVSQLLTLYLDPLEGGDRVWLELPPSAPFDVAVRLVQYWRRPTPTSAAQGTDVRALAQVPSSLPLLATPPAEQLQIVQARGELPALLDDPPGIYQAFELEPHHGWSEFLEPAQLGTSAGYAVLAPGVDHEVAFPLAVEPLTLLCLHEGGIDARAALEVFVDDQPWATYWLVSAWERLKLRTLPGRHRLRVEVPEAVTVLAPLDIPRAARFHVRRAFFVREGTSYTLDIPPGLPVGTTLRVPVYRLQAAGSAVLQLELQAPSARGVLRRAAGWARVLLVAPEGGHEAGLQTLDGRWARPAGQLSFSLPQGPGVRVRLELREGGEALVRPYVLIDNDR